MNSIILGTATTLLVIGYMIHGLNFIIMGQVNLAVAMGLFGLAMVFLFL